jgi:hypothetical protein
MNAGRFSFISTMIILSSCLLMGTAFAGFFDGNDTGKSGLDFTSGYDVNTVTTVSGRVISLPNYSEKQNVIVEVKSGTETLNLYVGPGSYWDKKKIAINLNDELTVKGSKAQGKDGKLYLLAQKVVNRTSGVQLELRNENGEPAWVGRDMNSPRSERSPGSMKNQGGAMMRGGGMMRR